MALVATATDPAAQKLRVGIFADSPLQPRWVVEACVRVAASEFAEIAALTLADGDPRRAPWAFRVAHDELLDLRRVPAVEPFEEPDLDVALALGAFDDTTLDGIARLGVWRLHADGLREVVEGAPLTACSLRVRLAAGTEPRIAAQSWSRTERLSIARNRARTLAKASELAWRALRDAQRFGRGWLEQCKAVAERPQPAAISTPVAARAVLRNRGLALLSSLRETEERYLACRRGGGPITPALEGFTRLPVNGRSPIACGSHIFFERAGRIYVMDAHATKPVALMEGSYPFVVENYLLTEGRLYRALEFPLRWELEYTFDEPVRNATLYRAGERWWLFATARHADELDLYHAPKISGPWTPHPRNPVKSDARCTRPAGRLYWRNGALYRPALFCAPREGEGVALNRVLRLTPYDYAERHVETIPGIRSINNGGELTVVDAFSRRSRFA